MGVALGHSWKLLVIGSGPVLLAFFARHSVDPVLQMGGSSWWPAFLGRLHWRRNLWVSLDVWSVWFLHFFNKHRSVTWWARLHLDSWPMWISLVCQHLVLNLVAVDLGGSHWVSELDRIAQVFLALLDLVKSVPGAWGHQRWVFGRQRLFGVLHAWWVIWIPVSLTHFILWQSLSN